MASSFPSFQPHPLLLPGRTGTPNPLLSSRTFHFDFSSRKPSPSPSLRGGFVVVRLGPGPGPGPGPGLPDFETAEGWARELLGRAEGVLYTVADAAVSSSSSADAPVAPVSTEQTSDWLSGITNSMETVLKVLKDGLSSLHVPYAYGFAIILLTVIVKAAMFPFTKKQVESAMAIRSLQPQVKAIQERYAGDQERIQLETARLYKLAGVNPLAGCLPTLATIPVWIGLYRALSNVANEGLLTEGFFWIPSLAGPTTIASRQSGSGTSWLFPFVDGHPPLGWSDTLAYLVLPVLLVVSQYISAQIMQPSQGNDPSQKNSQAVTKILPLVIGYFSLSVPSGLSLYWFTNNILSTAQQIWLQKLGGAKKPVTEFSDRRIKETELDIQTASEIDSDKVKSIREEKSERVEVRLGERFKQIKEQESRRRQEREEQRRRAAEAAEAKESQVNNEAHDSEAKFIESIESKEQKEAVVSKAVNERLQSVTSMHDSSKITTMVNGGHSDQEFEEEQTKIHSSMTKNGGVSCNGDAVVKDKQSAQEYVQKEEKAETYTPTGNKTSSECDVIDRKEEESERNEV